MMSMVKVYLMGFIADETPQKERLVNGMTVEQKLSQQNRRKTKGKKGRKLARTVQCEASNNVN